MDHNDSDLQEWQSLPWVRFKQMAMLPWPNTHIDSVYRKQQPQLPPSWWLQPETAPGQRPPTETSWPLFLMLDIINEYPGCREGIHPTWSEIRCVCACHSYISPVRFPGPSNAEWENFLAEILTYLKSLKLLAMSCSKTALILASVLILKFL